MKIVVLCGGLSTERNISFLSGTKVCRALRSRGHQAVLVDLFMGLEDETRDPAELFEDLPELKPLTFDGTAPDLKAVKRARKWKSPSLFGKGVLEICRLADMVFVALHGMNGEDGRVQATFDMLGIAIYILSILYFFTAWGIAFLPPEIIGTPPISLSHLFGLSSTMHTARSFTFSDPFSSLSITVPAAPAPITIQLLTLSGLLFVLKRSMYLYENLTPVMNMNCRNAPMI